MNKWLLSIRVKVERSTTILTTILFTTCAIRDFRHHYPLTSDKIVGHWLHFFRLLGNGFLDE